MRWKDGIKWASEIRQNDVENYRVYIAIIEAKRNDRNNTAFIEANRIYIELIWKIIEFKLHLFKQNNTGEFILNLLKQTELIEFKSNSYGIYVENYRI